MLGKTGLLFPCEDKLCPGKSPANAGPNLTIWGPGTLLKGTLAVLLWCLAPPLVPEHLPTLVCNQSLKQDKTPVPY